MAKDKKYQAKKVYFVIDNTGGKEEIKICSLENVQPNSKETLGEFRDITNEDDFYYVVIANFNSTNSRKKTSYTIVDADNNIVKDVRCDGVVEDLLKVDAVFVSDAGIVCEMYKQKLASAVQEA